MIIYPEYKQAYCTITLPNSTIANVSKSAPKYRANKPCFHDYDHRAFDFLSIPTVFSTVQLRDIKPLFISTPFFSTMNYAID